MALYADENFPLRVIAELRRLGFDVLTAALATLAELPWRLTLHLPLVIR